MSSGVSGPVPCAFCSATIRWVTMVSGKKMALEDKGLMAVEVSTEGKGKLRRVWMPHWGSCKGADQARAGGSR